MRIDKHRKVLSSFIIFLVITLAGCGAGSGAPDNKDPVSAGGSAAEEPADIADVNSETYDATSAVFDYYNIPQNFGSFWIMRNWTVDRNGVTIPEDRQFRILYDVLTGEPQCMVLSKDVETGRGEFNDIITRQRSALYDLEGNLISDWDDYDFYEGFGDYIVRQESWQYSYSGDEPWSPKGGLWNFKEKQTLIDGAFQVARINDDRVLLSEIFYRPMGVVDKNGNKIAGFPLPEIYKNARPWNGYIIASDESYAEYNEFAQYRSFLLDSEFQQILSYDFLEESTWGNILRYRENDGTKEGRNGIITIEGKELFRIQPEEYSMYFDDDFLILRSGEYDSVSNPLKYKIVSLKDGETLFEGFEMVEYYLQYEDSGPPENFLIYKDDHLQVFNRQNGLTASKVMPNLLYFSLYKHDVFGVSVQNDNGDIINMLYGADLEPIIPQGKYNSISPTMKWTGKKYEYYDKYIGSIYENNYSRNTSDLLDADGTVLVGGLSAIYDVGRDRISVRKGFDVGLMDWHGNWIVKRSMFAELQDD